ncbi:hypothetical protein BJY01DRAFT_247131 [Aspergillus pseudoustus]|uniref:Glyoxalase/fosfomycin resistance/dioxygenase domain-containing protein n=1 Tax=Aspergillus pseudoustus TaxID=1810923 RepID=A0ABR4K5Z7_9EURO
MSVKLLTERGLVEIPVRDALAMAAHLLTSAWKVIPIQERKMHPKGNPGLKQTPRRTSTSARSSLAKKAEANIYFSAAADEGFRASSAMIALGANELDEFYAYLRRANVDVEFLEPVDDKEWGFRQFTIQDPDGNKLTFFKFLEGGNPGDE